MKRAVETAAAHSGYDFFRPPFKAEMHDLHHEKFNVNYGGVWMLDWLHGTDKLPGEFDRVKGGVNGEGSKED